MGLLRGGNQQTQTPVYSGLQIQTASSAIPIPILFGVNKIAPNVIWNGGFYGLPVGSKGKGGGGGKGGVVGKGQNPQNYYCEIMLALCEGPLTFISAVWDNSTIEPLANVKTLAGNGVLSGGVPAGGAWELLQEHYPTQALEYPGVIIVTASQCNLGESATMDSYSFEVQGPLSFTGFNAYDADPALCVQALLTGQQFGLGFPADSIDMSTLLASSSGDASYQSYCRAQGFAISPALTDQETASSILERWLKVTNTAAIWSGGQLKFVPYGDTPLTGPIYRTPTSAEIVFATNNAAQSYTYPLAAPNQAGTWSYTPNVTPVYNLTDDDFVADENADPVQVTRIDLWEAPNYVNLEISQRSNFYDATPVTAFDQSAIEKYELRIAPTVTAHEICDPAIAQTSAQLILQRGQYIRRNYKFKLSWEYCLLEPMDLVTLTDPLIGLNNAVVRVTSITEGDDGLLDVGAEEFPNGIATAVQYPVQAKQSTGIATNAPAPSINAPLIFEPPFALSGELAVWIAVSPAQNGQSWGGCNILISTDNDSFTQIGEVVGSSVVGSLLQPLPPVAQLTAGGAVLDSVDVLAVDLTESAGTLNSVSASVMNAGGSACFVGQPPTGEIVSFQNAELTAADKYALSPLMRGMFGSEIESHPTGSLFAALTGTIFKQAFQPSQIGQTIYFKFQSFNSLGGGLQPIEDCPSYSYTLTGLGLAGPVAIPQNPRLAFDGQFAELTWDIVSDSRGTVTYQIKQGPTATEAQPVGVPTLNPPFRLTTPGTYFVFATVTPMPGVTITSQASDSVTLTANMLVTNLLELIDEQEEGWQGSLVNLEISGAAPAQQLILNAATSVDFGSTSPSDPVAKTDDFGTTNDDVIVPIDLGFTE